MELSKTGGRAFPVPDDASDMPGMTLRDYFAAKAMQAYINSYPGGLSDYRDVELWAPSAAYEMADAMLKARAA